MNDLIDLKLCSDGVKTALVDEDYEQALSIASRRHDIIGMHIYDRAEKELPNVGLMRIKDAETDEERIIDTSQKSVRTRYANWFIEHEEAFKTQFKKAGLDVISIQTDQDYVKSLLKFFKKRGR